MHTSQCQSEQSVKLKCTTRILLLLAILVFTQISLSACGPAKQATDQVQEKPEEAPSNELTLSLEAIKRAGIQISTVSRGAASISVTFPGVVEANQQKLQQVTPLVAGRVEKIYPAIGDTVRKGAVITTISSPQIAELHGKLHEADTKLALARENLKRVQQSANRVAILKAEADLRQAEHTLKRVRQLEAEGIVATKDVIAAEADNKKAKSELEFQKNITLNREVAAAKAEVKTAETEFEHIRDSLIAFGAQLPSHGHSKQSHDISLTTLKAPMSGTVVERLANPGEGIEAGKPLFTIADISSVWVIATVPEAQIGDLREGMQTTVTSAVLGDRKLTGRIAYIDPRINEDTRTARVRVEVLNADQRLKMGMFAQVSLQLVHTAPSNQILVPDTAVQTAGDRTVVFVQKPGDKTIYLVRDVKVGQEIDGKRQIVAGLSTGEQVVVSGAFQLKSVLLKEQFGEEE